MSSNPPRPKQSSRWGSLLSGAVAGIESRLDTILAEDNEASAKSRAADRAALEVRATNLALPTDSTNASRSSSRNRVNDRLQERLAKAVQDKKGGSQAPSETPTRTASPLARSESPRTSLSSRLSVDFIRPSTEQVERLSVDPVEQPGLHEEPTASQPASETTGTLLTSGLPINPARTSIEPDARPPIDSVDAPTPTSEPADTTDDHLDGKTVEDLEIEMAQMRADHAEAERLRQEEMHANLERIDALQAKLQYLAKDSVAAAKEANAEASKGSLDQKMAEKDEKIALLMEEGEKLSKTEMRHLATIRKMRAKTSEDEKATVALRKTLSKFEQTDSESKQSIRRLEQLSQQNREQLRQLPQVESELQAARKELESYKTNITTLRTQLSDAEKRFNDAEHEGQKTAQQADLKKISDLQDELSDAKLERKLTEERANAETKRLKGIADSQKAQSQSLELELRSEVSNMESRMEALRYRAEEASSDTGGDTQAKLLRQIETLQTQYSLAAENWRSIEGSLNSRVTGVEKERDEATKREVDVRKKARDMSNKSRRFEEELESASEQLRKLNDSLEAQYGESKILKARLDTSEKALEDVKADFDRQRRIWEAEANQRLEEERSRHIGPGLGISGQTPKSKYSQAQSPVNHNRKNSALDSLISSGPRRSVNRVFSNDSNNLMTDRAISRRSSVLPTPILPSAPLGSISRASATPDYGNSPTVSRQQSAISLSHFNGIAADIPATPSITTADVDADDFDRDSSPHQTANEVMSAATVHTGPSVQLVERMSSSIRRLESEKAGHREELARLLAQRDEARDEVVALMREVEGTRGANERVAKLEKESAEVKGRYEACLEMVGEKEEEILELRGDVDDLKAMYRELAEKMR